MWNPITALRSAIVVRVLTGKSLASGAVGLTPLLASKRAFQELLILELHSQFLKEVGDGTFLEFLQWLLDWIAANPDTFKMIIETILEIISSFM